MSAKGLVTAAFKRVQINLFILLILTQSADLLRGMTLFHTNLPCQVQVKWILTCWFAPLTTNKPSWQGRIYCSSKWVWAFEKTAEALTFCLWQVTWSGCDDMQTCTTMNKILNLIRNMIFSIVLSVPTEKDELVRVYTSPLCVTAVPEICRCNLLLHCPFCLEGNILLTVNLALAKRGEKWLCAIKSPVDQCAERTPCQSCCGWPVAVMLRSSSLWVCSTCWPNSLKEDASPVAPCGQTEHTRPLWLSCVPVAWGESFSCSTVSSESSATSTPNCWETGTCSVLLYCESQSTLHFNLYEFHQEKWSKTSRIHIQERCY